MGGLVGLAQTWCLRLFLPLGLGAAAVLRPSLLSLLYGLCALVSPAVPSRGGSTKAFLLLCLGVSLVGSLSQAAFQIAVAVSYDASELRPSCQGPEAAGNLSRTGDYLFHLGLQTWSGAAQASRVLLSDLVALLVSAVAVLLCVVLRAAEDEQELSFDGLAEDLRQTTSGLGASELSWGQRLAESALKATDVGAVLLLCLMGTVTPSALNLLYFLAFLGLMGWWALYSPPVSRSPLNRVKALLILYAGVHIVLEYLYQLPAVHAALPADGQLARSPLSAFTSSPKEATSKHSHRLCMFLSLYYFTQM
ncbi:MAG: hypothetical protein AAF202_03835 [Pseudomonadota bacterium]